MQRVLFNCCALILDLFLWCLILPLVLPIGGIFILYKSLVRLLILIFRSDLTTISTNDLYVARATLKEKPIVDIGFVLKIKGKIDIGTLKEKFRENFLNRKHNSNKGVDRSSPFYRLHCTFETFLGYLCTKKVEVSLEKQIYRENGSDIKSDLDVQNYFSKWLHSAYRNSRLPRWEMVLIHGEEGGQLHSYVGFRMHHGLIDGFGMLLIVDALCGRVSPYLVNVVEPSLTRKLKLLQELPRQTVVFFWKAYKASMPFPHIGDADKVSFFNVGWTTISLDKIKAVRRKLDLPFTTVLYSLQTGALVRFLKENGRSDEITKTLPVFHTIPKPNHPRNIFTNHWTCVKLHTPFSESDPLKRTKGIQKEIDAFLEDGLHITGPQFMVWFMGLFPTRWCFLNWPTPISKYKAALSSMVRAPEEYQFEGRKVENIYHTFCTKDLCPDAVLYTTTASHNNQCDITLSAHPALIGGQEKMRRLCELWEKELDDLALACN